MQQFFNVSAFLFDLIFPPICLNCDTFGEHLCQNCKRKIVISHEQICPHCFASLRGKNHQKCKGPLNGITACWLYEGVVQKVIKEIKYRFHYASISPVAELYLKGCTPDNQKELYAFLLTKPVVIPVPIHPKRLKERGFNQATLLGRFFAKQWQLPFSEKILVRQVHTKPQAELKAQERAKNMKNVFTPAEAVLKLGKKPLAGKNILLADDVVTTGATLKECAKVLKHLGADRVWGIALAR